MSVEEQKTEVAVEPTKVPQEHGGALTPWQKGQSGNPAGKPKGAKHLSTVIQEFMDDENFELKIKDNETIKGRPSKALTEVMFRLAVMGNVKAADWLAKYGYGMKQVHEFMNNPITDILGKYGLKEDKPKDEPPKEEPKTEDANAGETPQASS